VPGASERFPYQRIVKDLRDGVLTGRLEPDRQLPSENELAAEYGVSRPTVRRALAVLRSEGLIVTRQGSGIFVRPRGQVGITVTGGNYRRHRAVGLPGFNAQALEQGQRPRQEIREVARIPASSEVAMRLDIDNGTEVIVRRRIFWLEEEPAAITDSYYPADMAAGTALERPGRIKGGAHAIIEDPDGQIRRHVARSVDEITGGMPTPEESRLLGLSPGVPVFRILRTVYDTQNRPVEVQDSIAAADRHRFCYEVDMS
jgi:GntR family transcriptional regulator